MSRTRATLVASALRRLNDDAQSFWTADEVATYLARGYREYAQATRCFWDQLYLENLPAGFSCTAAWEVAYETFHLGIGNYTMDDERRLLTETSRVGPANHTSPFEATDGFLSRAGASTAIPATAQLPDTVVTIDRPTWDGMTIASLSPSEAERRDSRYELTKGEVYAVVSMKDGHRTVRKVRVPAAQAATYTVTGSWGILRRCTDLSGEAVTGTWGVPRRIPGLHPMGSSSFGIPRRPYRDGTNVRIEHWREGRAVSADTDTFELPDRATLYLRDYAMWQCLARRGPAQDLRLAAFYQQCYQRGVDRMRARMDAQQRNRVGQMGGPAYGGRVSGPPRPKFPWAYGQEIRQ